MNTGAVMPSSERLKPISVMSAQTVLGGLSTLLTLLFMIFEVPPIPFGRMIATV